MSAAFQTRRAYIRYWTTERDKQKANLRNCIEGNVETIAHSRIYAGSSNSWDTSGFRLFMETFCSPGIVSVVANINICCLFSKIFEVVPIAFAGD